MHLSPDLNYLDLCFFWSLFKRSDKLKEGARNFDDLIAAVQQAFDDYDSETLDRCYGSWCVNVLACIKDKGGNDFKTPHSGVRAHQNAGQPVDAIAVDKELVDRMQTLANTWV